MIRANIKLKMKDYVLSLMAVAVLCLMACSANTKKNVSEESDLKRAGLNLSNADSYIVHLKYRQKVEGYEVIVDFSPRTSITHGQCCTELYMGKAILHFANDSSSFNVECEEFSDSSLICYTNSDPEHTPRNNKSVDLGEIESGDTIVLDYLPPKAQEYFSWNSPFYFLDMDFDGRKELLVNNMGCGYYGGNTYDVFSLIGSVPQKMVGYPFEQEGVKLNSDCEYNPQKKTLYLRVKNGMEIVSIAQQSLFDGDPKVSGSTEHIETIMKSIANSDARTLASLTIFPIARRYPLHNIVDSSDMIKRFNQIFDQKFRDRMKSSKASDWHSYGWRGYSYGEENSLWVYDSLTFINYYSPQEKALYDQLVKKEMASLHESLRGNGWHPYCCFKDIIDGSIVRIDIHVRKTMKNEIIHVSGDDKFRMSIYPKGNNLMGKPGLLLNGNVSIEGSANMMDYCFKSGGTKIEFGDSFFEDGKELLRISINDKEITHEIKPCYWLDLLHVD